MPCSAGLEGVPVEQHKEESRVQVTGARVGPSTWVVSHTHEGIVERQITSVLYEISAVTSRRPNLCQRPAVGTEGRRSFLCFIAPCGSQGSG